MPASIALRKPGAEIAPAAAAKRAHVIVFGNEKGGTGKTTTAMHIAVALGRLGKKVAAVDLDGRQRTFARYIENRSDFVARTGHKLAIPSVHVVERAKPGLADPAGEEAIRLEEALAAARDGADFVVIDTPGNDTNLSRIGHASADTLVTPMNDSFLDFDLLAKVDPESMDIKSPSLYAEFVWECRKRRLMSRRANLDWVVMRNRVAAVEARNKRRVSAALDKLSSRIGCRVAPGFSERVIFRELFPMGLTMLDLPLSGLGMSLTMSHIAARQEVRELLSILHLPGLEEDAAA
jgi:chromosome partitioning protein